VGNQLQNQHLLWRAGFGPAVEQVRDLDKVSPPKLYDALVKASSRQPVPFTVANNVFDGLMNGIQDVRRMELSKEQKKELQKKSREEIRNLNLEWLDEMTNSEQQLREKMAFFWHGHFACRNLNVLYQQQLVNTIRANALGNFGTLLKEVSRSAAMLAFLNNQQNRKQKPNENFAREVMELFTMGRGNYTEKDIKEAARAFTGWQFQLNGEFVFRPNLHDDGQKTVLGKTGNFDGDDVLNILLEQKQTAIFIVTKIYRFFVNEQTDPEKIQMLANQFYQSGYDIGALMKSIFTSGWFYDAKNMGALIKSPVQLIAGIRRILPMDIETPAAMLLAQKVLGQILFYPPNVAGWPGGRNWIDSSSLMFRLKMPQIIAGQELLNIRPKSDDDQDMGRMQQKQPKQGRQNFSATIKWDQLYEPLSKTTRENLFSTISSVLIQHPSEAISKTDLEAFFDSSTRERYIQSAIIRLMSTPDYQLC